MKINFVNFLPQNKKPIRSMHLNLIAEKNIVLSGIQKLSEQLQEIINDENVLQLYEHPQAISRAPKPAIEQRIEELKNNASMFKTSQLTNNYSADELVLATEGLALQLQNAGINFMKPGVIEIKEFAEIYYDQNGIIISSQPDLKLTSLNAIEVIAGFCAQDFGLVLESGAKLIYFYGSARYEKTPKHIENGYDYFVGSDFLEWHKRIPVWGEHLVALFERLYLAFQQEKMDMLTVDLKGRNLYTNGEVTLCRYERDYAVPLRNYSGCTIGLTVFADSLYKDINDETQLFFGGKHLQILSPKTFHENFKVIKHDTFCHHPFGMRSEDGRPNTMLK